MRLGVDEVGVTELMGVSEHTRARATAATGLCLDSLDAERALVPPLDPSTAEEPAKALLEEIAAWAEAVMGRRAAPVLWRGAVPQTPPHHATRGQDPPRTAPDTPPHPPKQRCALSAAQSRLRALTLS